MSLFESSSTACMGNRSVPAILRDEPSKKYSARFNPVSAAGIDHWAFGAIVITQTATWLVSSAAQEAGGEGSERQDW